MSATPAARTADEGGRIRVAVRVRPLATEEAMRGGASLLRVSGETLTLTTNGWKSGSRSDATSSRNKHDVNDSSSTKFPNKVQSQRIHFRYDSVFDTVSCNAQVYEALARSVVHSVMTPAHEARLAPSAHGLVLAYGQTSSGKTHTMEGNELDLGIIPRAIADVFAYSRGVFAAIEDENQTAGNDKRRRHPVIHVSYVEVYNDRVKDLIRPSGADVVLRDAGPTVFSSASRTRVRNASDALALLKQGAAVRAVGDTPMNVRSSRSHTVFTLHIRHAGFEARDACADPYDGRYGGDDVHYEEMRYESTLQLVDLAGSERVRHTDATGSRLREGGHINQSLLVLGTIISRLSAFATKSQQKHNAQQLGHLPFRDSKLTRLLRPALQPGSGARVAILATVTPSQLFADETLSTLQFASRAKNIPLISGPAHNTSMLDQNQRKKNMEDAREYQRRYTELSQEFDSFRETFAKLQEELEQLRQQKSVANLAASLPENEPYRPLHLSRSATFSDAEPTDSATLVTTSLSAPSTCVSSSKSSTASTKSTTTMSSSSTSSSSSPSGSPSSASVSPSSVSDNESESSKSVTDSSCATRSISKRASIREKSLTVHVAELEAENEHLRDRLRTMVADVCRQRLRSAMLHSLARSRSRRTSFEANFRPGPSSSKDRLNAGIANNSQNLTTYATFTRQKSGTSGMGPRMLALASGRVGSVGSSGSSNGNAIENSGIVHDGRRIVSGRNSDGGDIEQACPPRRVRDSWTRDSSELGHGMGATLAIVPSQPPSSDAAELVPYFTRVLDSSSGASESASQSQHSWLADAAQNVSVLLRFIVDSFANRRQV